MKDKTVIFDFDGTLADTLNIVVEIYNQHASQFKSKPLTAEELPELRKMGYRKAMKRKNVRWSMLPRMVTFLSREMRQHMHKVSPYDGIIKSLKELKAEGARLGVLTSNEAGLVQDFIASHDFPMFEFVVAERNIFGKERSLKRILKRNDLALEDVIYVGDEPRDVVACKKAGVKIIGVTWGFGGREGFEIEAPDIIITKPSELTGAVKKLFK